MVKWDMSKGGKRVTTMVYDSLVEQRLKAERAASGADRYDEVWEGVYMMAPMPNHEHQLLVGRWTRVLDEIVTDRQLGEVVPGINVSDRIDNWEQNYRVPDVAVFLKGTRAVNHDSFWYGGPDFAVEIVSRHDQTREKIDFYGKIGTRELLVIDRDPWRLELYRLGGGILQLAASAGPCDRTPIVSHVLEFRALLQPSEHRPLIQVDHAASDRTWTI